LKTLRPNSLVPFTPLVLRRGPTELWLNVELNLWKALAETVKQWVQQRPAAASPYELEAWREALLVSLTESAFYIVLNNGTKGSLLDLKWSLYRVVRLVTRRRSRVRQSE
jgi:hypothetical protein